MNYDLLFKKAKENDIKEIEIYSVESKGLNFRVFKGKLDSYKVSNTSGLSVRGIYNGKMGYVFTENVCDESIDYLIEQIKDNASIIGSDDLDIIFEGSKEYKPLELYNESFDKVDTKDKIDMMKKLEEKILSKDERITDVGYCMYSESSEEVRIMNNKGLDLEKKTNGATLYVSALAKENGENKTAGEFILTNDITDFDIDKISEKVAEEAISKLGGGPVKSGDYQVILNNEASSDLLSPMVDIFSADNVQKGKSLLKGKLNTKIASECVSIIDDPFREKSLRSTPFDDEGVACKYKELIKGGVLQTFFYNLKTAQKDGVESTGNGFKASFRSSVDISPSNLYINSGEKSLEEMMSTVSKGILITEIEGTHAGINPISGDFSLQASGYLIEDGKKSRPVNLITIAGNFFELLNDVVELGNDLKFNYNFVGSPSVKLNKLKVSGE